MIYGVEYSGDVLMNKSVRARYSDGVLTLRESLDLEEGEEVVVSITTGPSVDELSNGESNDASAPDLAAGGWKGLVDGEKLKREIYESRRLVTRSEPKF